MPRTLSRRLPAARSTRGWVLAAVTAVALCAAPSAATAATQLGQVQADVNLASCEGAFNLIQRSSAPQVSYRVPAGGGVITSWRHRARADEGDEEPALGRLQVWRQAGDAGYRLVGRSALEAFAPGVVNGFETEIPVAAGDLIGLHARGKPHGCATEPVFGAGDVLAVQHFESEETPVDPMPGFTLIPPEAIALSRLNVAATLEDAPPPAIELSLEAAPKQKVKRLEVTVGCGPVACEADLRGKAVAKGRKKSAKRARAGAAAKRGRKYKVKAATFSIAASETTTVPVKFKRHRKTVKRLRRALKRKSSRGRSKAKLKVSATGSAGSTAAASAKVKLKR